MSSSHLNSSYTTIFIFCSEPLRQNCYSNVAYSVVIRVTFVLYAVFYYSLDVNEDQWELISDTISNLSMSRRLHAS